MTILSMDVRHDLQRSARYGRIEARLGAVFCCSVMAAGRCFHVMVDAGRKNSRLRCELDREFFWFRGTRSTLNGAQLHLTLTLISGYSDTLEDIGYTPVSFQHTRALKQHLAHLRRKGLLPRLKNERSILTRLAVLPRTLQVLL
jgi:hypothetical protein